MRIVRRATTPLTALAAGALLLVGCSSSTDSAERAREPSGAPSGAPSLTVEVLARGLDHPWDVAQAPDGTLLVDERAGGLTAVRPDGRIQPVRADFGDLFARGETGLMGLLLDPGFAGNRRFYTCQGGSDAGADGGPGIQVVAWTVAADWRTATRAADPLLGGIPVNATSGRHGGCRLRFDPTGALMIGTGDNAVGTNAQDLTSLAGKVLRIDPATGCPAAGNPFPDAGDPRTRLVYSYGHRNVQGIAVQPGTNQVYTVEQGTTRDDEVNVSVAGGNFGYDPDGADGGYDESVPMTDTSIPGAISAVWSSGSPTIATSGGTFLDGAQWGTYEGLMLVGVQKDTGVLALRIGPDGALAEEFRIPEVEDDYGRIRTPQLGTDGALYLTTDNGDGADQLLRVTPAG